QQVEVVQPFGAIVIAQIGTGNASTAERAMGAQTDVERPFINLRRNWRRGQVVRSTRRVFRGVVVETAAGDDFADPKRSIAHDRDGQLASGNKTFDQQLIAVTPSRHLFSPRIVIYPHDSDADAGTLVGRL